MQEIYLVLKNVDFTEGRGPMAIHSVWSNWKDANDFILDQYGIMGTKQYLSKESWGWGTNPEKGRWTYNGYEIKKVSIFETYDKNNFNSNGDLKCT